VKQWNVILFKNMFFKDELNRTVMRSHWNRVKVKVSSDSILITKEQGEESHVGAQ
jgi:hypothetical protein